MNNCLGCGKSMKSNLPYCRPCLKTKWQYSKNFIKPKHDPTYLPWSLPRFRSVVTMDFITNADLFIQTISEDGSYYYDYSHNNYCCVLYKTLGNVSGSAIPSNYSMPTYPLDSIFVADAINNAHVYAVDSVIIQTEIFTGRFTPIK